MSFQGFTVSPPYAGLDLVSPIDAMDPSFALELVNVIPGASAPSVRLGYEKFAETSVAAPLKTLVTLPLQSGTNYLVAASDTKLYRVDSSGTITDHTNATPHTEGFFNTVVFGNRLYLCNGVDNAQVYDGSGAAQDVTFTGVTLNLLKQVSAYRERLYFVEKDSAKVWYGGTQVTGVGGTPALTSFDFQYVFTQGGRLEACGSYSNTTNIATQQLFWGCSSEGELAFFAGTYPGDTNWQIVARYYIGEPVGCRAFIPVNQDIWIITHQGIVPMSALFQTDPQQALQAVSAKINPLISQYAGMTPVCQRWGGYLWPDGRRVYVSVPVSGLGCIQLVYSLDSKGWTVVKLYDDEHALGSCVYNNKPFYSSSEGIIWQGETGQADAVVGTVSQAISFSGRTAFSFYGTRGNFKAFKDLRPLMQVKRGIVLNVGLDTDFRRAATVTTISTPSGVFTPWGSPWGSPWSAGVEYVFDRFATRGQGHSAAIRFGGGIKDTTLQILGFEVRFALGGQV